MSRRSPRLAKKASEHILENNNQTLKHAATLNQVTRGNISKKRRTELDQKLKSFASENSEDVKQGRELDIKGNKHFNEMKDCADIRTGSQVKSEEQLDELASKVTKEGKYIGAHVSISGGLYLAVERALEIGAKSFAMFLRSQRQWTAKPLKPEDAELFQTTCKKYDFSPDVILPHGIYLMNCGSPDSETLDKSRQVLVDELQRCEMLGLTLYNFHPGSTCGKISVEECLDKIAESINLAHEQTRNVVTVLENMSCQGNTVRITCFVA